MSNTTKVAVIGMSGVFPDAADLRAFYRNLRDGKDSVRHVSPTRLRHSSLPPAAKYRHVASLERIDLFDHRFFNISRQEADYMDPLQRILLQASCQAIENAGYNLDDFNGSSTAVYLGGKNESGQAYLEMLEGKTDATVFTGTLGSMAYGRVAYFLNLTGPAMLIDAACAASLVAIDQACEKLISGDVAYALAGGMSLNVFFPSITTNGYLGSHAPDGRSKTFDQAADGIGSGEGGAVFLLKRLDHALRDRDVVHAVVLGSAVNHDGGRSNGITAPSPEAQSEVIKKAWRKAGIDPRTVSYIETHGTGTKLGDPVEFKGITDAFNAFTGDRKFCALGSVKTNIGHLGSGAGAAGVVKAIFSLKHRELLPSLHFSQPNPFIDFENTAAYVHTGLTAWESDGPRRCGVSAFGLSGTNAHLVLEEGPAPVPAATPDRPAPLKIAAASPAALVAYARLIADYLQAGEAPLADALYTLNAGRRELPYRRAFFAQDRAALVAQLRAFAEAAPANLPAAPLKARRAVLLFSDPGYAPAALALLRARFGTFREHFEAIVTAGEDTGNPAKVCVFAYYYALFKLVESLGISVKTVIGTGPAKYITQYITGSLPLAPALAAYLAAEEAPVEEAKLRQLVRSLAAKDDVLFLETGENGRLFGILAAWQQTLRGLQVYRVPAGTQAGDWDALLAGLYSAGLAIDWKKYYAGGTYCRVEAPTYPFEPIRCWFEEPLAEPRADFREWLHTLRWLPQPAAASPGEVPATRTLLLLLPDGPGAAAGQALATHLRGNGTPCITVRPGDHFERVDEDHYCLNPAAPGDYAQLERELKGRKGGLHGIVHLGGMTHPDGDPLAAGPGLQDNFYTLYYCLKAFHNSLASRGFGVTVVTANAYLVESGDPAPSPFKAMSHVLLKAVLAEYPTLKVTGIDYHPAGTDSRDLAALVGREMHSEESVRFVVYRGRRRYLPQLVNVTAPGETGFAARPDEVYVVTGGASGIGYEVAAALARQARVHLVLLGRTNLPARETWASATGQEALRTGRLAALEALGATVSYYAVDLADGLAVRELARQLQARHPKIHGVFHAAGVGSSGVPLRNRQLADVSATLGPKVQGTLHLQASLAGLNPAFFVSFSSIGALVPAANSADYAAANAFQDAFAGRMHTPGGTRFLSINWADWKETGLSYRKSAHLPAHERDAREALIRAIPTREGIASLFYLLGQPHANVAVVEADLASFRVNPFFVIGGGDPLPDADAAPAPPADPDTRAFSDTERAVAGIWHQVLKLSEVQLDDDFFRIGGHSLNLSQMLARVEKQLGVRMEMREMLRYNTIRKLAGRLAELQSAGAAGDRGEIPALPGQPAYATSHAQQRFWRTQFGQAREAYNVPGGYRFTGLLDLALLQKAFVALIQRHEILRTTYSAAGGQVVQVIHPPAGVRFVIPYQDLSTSADPEAEAKRIAHQEAGAPFDLTTGPLLRARLLRLGPEVHVFILTLHHIVSDGQSMAILRNEVLHFYKSFRQNQAALLPPLRIQYKDFAAWQNQLLAAESTGEMKQYWLGRLTQPPAPFALPADLAGLATDPRADSATCELTGAALLRLRQAEPELNPSQFVIVFTLLHILFHKLTGQTDLLIGSPVGGRLHADLEDQIGNYLNTLLLRTAVRPDDSYGSLLVRVREQLQGDFGHQVYPLDVLLGELKWKTPAPFRTGFTWNLRGASEEASGLDLEVADFHTGFKRAKADLWFFGTEWEEGVSFEVLYRTALYKPATMQMLMERMGVLVEQCTRFPRKPLRDLELLLEEEKALRQPVPDFGLAL
jgi:3-oxoacyl-(acyl-carrier-protein) synthase/NAD(P)-dependent dehydrogenase (short-subunit alcohol dehydrogenase family)/acyl carrier protein